MCASSRKLTPNRLTSASLNSCLFTFTGDAKRLSHCKDYMLIYIAYLQNVCIFLPRLHTVFISILMPAPGSMFSVLCTGVLCLTLKVGIFLRQLWCGNPEQSCRYFPFRLTPVVLASNTRLYLQKTPGSPDDISYPSLPGSIECTSLPGEDGSPLLQLLPHQLITASGCQLHTGSTRDASQLLKKRLQVSVCLFKLP